MSQVIKLTKQERLTMQGMVKNQYGHRFFIVIASDGQASMSEKDLQTADLPQFEHLKERLLVDYQSIEEAQDLSTCLTSEHLDNEDLDGIYSRLAESNSLLNPVIRPSGIHSTNLEAKEKLMDSGIILVDDE